ncbi:hypothetical protein ACWDX6_11995 [Streptomyces sp. NPDC003027]
MGVFAMFRRKGKEAAEASPQQSEAVALTSDAEEAEGASDAPVAAAEAEATEDGGTAGNTEPAPAVDEAAESVEIPKQQSAGEAADNEAGESARK